MFIGDDTDKSMVLVFNKYISGYHLEAGSSEGNIGIPFVYDEKEEDAKYETVSLKYNKDKEKNMTELCLSVMIPINQWFLYLISTLVVIT